MFVHSQIEHLLDGGGNVPLQPETLHQPLDPDSIEIGARVIVRQVVEVAYAPDGSIVNSLRGRTPDTVLSSVHMLRAIRGIVTARPDEDDGQSTFHIRPMDGGPTAVVPGPKTPHWVDQNIASHVPGMPGSSVTGVFPASYEFHSLPDEQAA